MDKFWQDVRYAIRRLLKSPGFTIVVVLTLALGIGATTAIFSVVNAFLLRPLPVPNAEELTVLAVTHEGNEQPHNVSYLDYVDYRDHSDAFSGMAGDVLEFVGLSTGGRPERILMTYVTPNYFSMLGIQPEQGRFILPTEGQKPGADPVVVLSHQYWARSFGGDARVVGRSVNVNGQPVTIVGVAPEWFHGTFSIAEVDAYAPLSMAVTMATYKDLLTRRDSHDLRVLARLRPGVTLRQAQASLDVIASQLERQYPDTNKTVKIHVFPEHIARPEPSAATQSPLVAGVFMLLTGMVLLVACVNVANLLLVRATLRHKELAIRAALGAGRYRLMRQMLTESVVLALLGGTAGLLLGRWASSLLSTVRPPGDLPFRFDFSFDWRVFGVIAGIATLTGVAVGLLPGLRAAKADVQDALRDGGRTSAGTGRHRARNALVVAQVAVSMVLLTSTGLFVRSLRNAQNVDLGFRTKDLLLLSMDTAEQGYDEARAKKFYGELEQRVQALPGVVSASLAHSVPMGYYSLGEHVSAEGQELKPNERRPIAGYNLIGTDYFATMGIAVLRGRAFTAQDDERSRPVAVVNEYMAQHLWPGQDAIGRRFSMNGPKGPYIEVVGISKQGKYGYIFEDPGMYFFLPLAQNYKSLRALTVRTAVPPETLSPVIQQEVRALAPDLPVFDVLTMEQELDGGNGFFLLRLGAGFAAALGILGLVLALVGVYGVVSYAASQRTHEIGVRMALGAQRGDILRLIVSQGVLLVLVGLVTGAVAAVALSRFVANILFGISAHDPVTFVGVSLLLLAVGSAACWVPARRASHVDPMVALRYE